MPPRLHVPGIDGAVGRTPEYRAWINMKSRCLTPSATGWKNYGGRGITVCARWVDDFAAFYADMGPRPSPRHSVERDDVNGPYDHANCRWATVEEQARNKRSNHMVGDSILVDAIKASSLKTSTVATRISRGWPDEAALSRGLQKGVKYAP